MNYVPIDGESASDNYVLLGTDTDYIWNDRRITTDEAFAFIIRHPRYVGFYIHYDITHILRDAWPYTTGQWQTYGKWRWKYYPRKMFILRLGRSQSIIYDISGFCQSSFIRACEEWGVSVSDVVRIGKGSRSDFTLADKAFMIQYNREECIALRCLFERIREAVPYRLRHWHGSGAIASSMIRRYRLHAHSSYDVDVLHAAKSAYYGGRIELFKLGTIHNTYTYDIRSAYPYALSQLPTLSNWHHVKKYEGGVGWYYVRYVAPYDTYVGGLPVRSVNGIVYPLLAEGWYTSYEIENLLNYCEVVEGYVTFNEDRPFSVIEELYSLRATYRRQGHIGKSRALKLGLNSIYGKFAQREGGRYTDFGIASLITGYVRAMLYRTCHDSSVISYATDSITTTRPLGLTVGEGLGEWEETAHQHSVFLQPGVYQHDSNAPKVRGMPNLDVRAAAATISQGRRYSTTLKLFVTPHLHSLRKNLKPYSIISIEKFIDIVTKKREWILTDDPPDLLSRYYESEPHISAPRRVNLADRLHSIELDVIM